MLLRTVISQNLNLMKLGGAVTGKAKELGKRFFDGSLLTDNSNNQVVLISHLLKDNLTTEEFKAIYYHEEAHYIYQHNNYTPNQKLNELQADAYSARKIGPLVLLSALEKLPIIVRDSKELRELGTQTMSDKDYTLKVNDFLYDINIKMAYRYQALKNFK